jgi:hypothetical protein
MGVQLVSGNVETPTFLEEGKALLASEASHAIFSNIKTEGSKFEKSFLNGEIFYVFGRAHATHLLLNMISNRKWGRW